MKKEFRSFEYARKFVIQLKLSSIKEWKQYCKSGNKPDDIPSYPNEHYESKGWSTWGDWLGTGNIASYKIKFLPFVKSRKIIKSFHLSNREDWEDLKKSNNFPSGISKSPASTYKKEWKGWGDWLGTGNIATKNREYYSFEKARKFVRSLLLKNVADWNRYCKSNQLPSKIPKSPWSVYSKDWNGWGDWLGSGTIANVDKKFLSYNEAKKIIRKLNLKSLRHWQKLVSDKKIPNDIPKLPPRTYKKDWTSWADWLGTDNVKAGSVLFRKFEDARKFAQKLNFSGKKEWGNFAKTSKKPKNIPADPNYVYKNKGWKTWGDWLGTGTIATFDIVWLPWKDAKLRYQKIAKDNNIKNLKGWSAYLKTHKLPEGLPRYPDEIYKKERVRKMMK